MITNFTYGLIVSEKGNPVVYISYTSKNGNNKMFYGYNAVKICRSLRKTNQIDKAALFNVNSIKKATDESYKANHK